MVEPVGVPVRVVEPVGVPVRVVEPVGTGVGGGAGQRLTPGSGTSDLSH